MEKLKNFIYDKNDIVIALIIVILAMVIITGRINAIMTYPDKMAAEAAALIASTEPSDDGSVIDDASAGAETDGTGTDGTGTGTDNTETAADPLYPATESGSVYPGTPPGSGTTVTQPVTPAVTPPPAATPISISIPSGTTGEGIAKILLSKGLITQKSDFTNAIVGVENKLKAGTFKIPSGSTPAQIVAILTK
jgi:hypothetical protein